MKTILKPYKISDIVQGFVYNTLENKGLFGLDGRLTIQPEYQRNYVYAELNQEAGVIHSLLAEYPLGLIYFNKLKGNRFEVLDGQQRITSIGRFVNNKFAIRDANGMEQIFTGLPKDKQALIMNSTLLVYECEGTESEIKDWFKTINIKGVPLTDQELLNAVYSGPFVNAGKAVFSNSNSAKISIWSKYISGKVIRQDYWERALEWVSKGKDNIGGYMSRHRNDKNIDGVKAYFDSVIDWASSTFIDLHTEMKNLEWGRLYETFHKNPYNPSKISKRVSELHADEYVTSKKGIWEFVLGSEKDTRLLEVRVFDNATKKSVYEKQTNSAKANGKSNCSDCILENKANKAKIWKLDEMDADHVQAWSKQGKTNLKNCQVLCSRHNKVKGNK